MKLGLDLRNMGPQSTRPLVADAARAAAEAGVDDLRVADHLALAPEDAPPPPMSSRLGHPGRISADDRKREPFSRGEILGERINLG